MSKPNPAILTEVGRAKLLVASPEEPVKITHFAVGDGNGSYNDLSDTMTALVNERARVAATGPIRKADEGSLIGFQGVFTSAVITETFTAREVAIFDDAGDMIAIGQVVEIAHPAGDEAFESVLGLVIKTDNTESIIAVVDPSVIATKEYVDNAEARAKAHADDAADAAEQRANQHTNEQDGILLQIISNRFSLLEGELGSAAYRDVGTDDDDVMEVGAGGLLRVAGLQNKEYLLANGGNRFIRPIGFVGTGTDVGIFLDDGEGIRGRESAVIGVNIGNLDEVSLWIAGRIGDEFAETIFMESVGGAQAKADAAQQAAEQSAKDYADENKVSKNTRINTSEGIKGGGSLDSDIELSLEDALVPKNAKHLTEEDDLDLLRGNRNAGYYWAGRGAGGFPANIPSEVEEMETGSFVLEVATLPAEHGTLAIQTLQFGVPSRTPVPDTYMKFTRAAGPSGHGFSPWVKDVTYREKATEAQAAEGVDDNTWMTPFLTKKLIEKTAELIITEDALYTVGPSGDFTSINEALEYLSKIYPAYKKDGVKVELRLASGFVMSEQVFVYGIDLGWITITSEDSVVEIDHREINKVAVGSLGYSPVFYTDGGVLPTIGVLFEMTGTATDQKKPGVMVNNRGGVTVLPACGVSKAYGYGLYVVNSSIAHARLSVFSDAAYCAFYASRSSNISATAGDARRSYIGFWAEFGSTIEANEGRAQDCTMYGFHADLGSTINANRGDATGVTNGFRVSRGSFMLASDSSGTDPTPTNELTKDGVIFK